MGIGKIIRRSLMIGGISLTISSFIPNPIVPKIFHLNNNPYAKNSTVQTYNREQEQFYKITYTNSSIKSMILERRTGNLNVDYYLNYAIDNLDSAYAKLGHDIRILEQEPEVIMYNQVEKANKLRNRKFDLAGKWICGTGLLAFITGFFYWGLSEDKKRKKIAAMESIRREPL